MQGGFANGVDEVLDVTGQPVPGSILQPGIPAACSSIPTTVVSQIQAWLGAKPASERGAECWQQLPAILEATIERGIASAELQHADRDDLRQRVWIRIVHHFKGLDPATEIGALIAWAREVAENEAKREAYRRTRRARREETNQDEFLHSLVNENSDEDLDLDRLKGLVREVIRELEAAGRVVDGEILTLRYVEGLALREVAAKVGLTMNQLCGRYKRARAVLRLRIASKADSGRGARDCSATERALGRNFDKKGKKRANLAGFEGFL